MALRPDGSGAWRFPDAAARVQRTRDGCPEREIDALACDRAPAAIK